MAEVIILYKSQRLATRARLIVLGALLVVAVLVACLPAMAAARTSKVTLRLWGGTWGIPPKYDSSPTGRANRAVFEEFRRWHPDIEIISSQGLTIQGPANESNFLLAMAGGTAPDVFYVNFRKLHTYIDQNFMQPLDEFIKEDPKVLDRVHPEVRKVITINGQEA